MFLLKLRPVKTLCILNSLIHTVPLGLYYQIVYTDSDNFIMNEINFFLRLSVRSRHSRNIGLNHIIIYQQSSRLRAF